MTLRIFMKFVLTWRCKHCLILAEPSIVRCPTCSDRETSQSSTSRSTEERILQHGRHSGMLISVYLALARRIWQKGSRLSLFASPGRQLPFLRTWGSLMHRKPMLARLSQHFSATLMDSSTRQLRGGIFVVGGSNLERLR